MHPADKPQNSAGMAATTAARATEEPVIPICETCGEPTREVIPVELRRAVGMDSHPRDCACDRARKEGETERRQAAEEGHRRRRNLEMAQIPLAHAKAGFGNLETGPLDSIERKQLETAISECRGYVDGGCLGSLVLTGPVGVGKSHLAVAVLRSAILDHGHTGRYWNWTCEWDRIRSCYARGRFDEADALLEDARRAEILVLDDVGGTVLEGGQLDRAYGIVEYRSVNGLSWIVTTNASRDELVARLSERIVDRLFDRRRTFAVTLSGLSWRQR